jgi:hypothetical protein
MEGQQTGNRVRSKPLEVAFQLGDTAAQLCNDLALACNACGACGGLAGRFQIALTMGVRMIKQVERAARR